MSEEWRAYLEADLATIEGLLKRLPTTDIAARIGLESRRAEVKAELEGAQRAET